MDGKHRHHRHHKWLRCSAKPVDIRVYTDKDAEKHRHPTASTGDWRRLGPAGRDIQASGGQTLYIDAQGGHNARFEDALAQDRSMSATTESSPRLGANWLPTSGTLKTPYFSRKDAHMLHRGHIYVRLSTKLAAAFGMSYRQLWNEATADDSGFSLLRVPTRDERRSLCYMRLDEINRALGYGLYEPRPLSKPVTEETDHADHEETAAQG
jgi:hypothetical protein